MSSLLAALAASSARLVAALGMIVLVVLTLAENSVTRLFLWPWFFFAEALFLLPIIWVAAGALRWPRFPSLGRLLDLGLIGLAATAVGAASLSPHRWLSLVFAAPYVSAAALSYVLHSWLTEDPTRRAERDNKLGLIVGLPFALFSILTLAHWLAFEAVPVWSRLGWSAELPRNQYPFGHSTYTAGFTILVLPWLTYLAMRAQTKARLFWMFATLCGLLIIPSTSSRGGVLGMAVMLSCAILLFLSRAHVSTAHRVRALIATIVGLVLLVAFNPRLRDLALTGHWNAGSDASNLQRSAMIDAGLRMGRDRPLIGQGPGTVPLVYPLYRSGLSGGVENVLQLHNTPVQLWAEMGAFGVLFSSLILLGVAQAVFKAWRASKAASFTSTGLPLFAGIGLIGYTAFAVTDYQLDLPAIAATIACFIAILAAPDKPRLGETPWSIGRRMVSTGIGTLTTILLLSAIIPFGRVRQLSTRAAAVLAKGDHPEFIQLNTKAAAILHQDPMPINQIAGALIEDRSKATDDSIRTILASNILLCFVQSLRRNPAQEYVHFNFGWLLLELGQAKATDHFRAAANLVPDKGGVYLGLALALQREGHEAQAAFALALECLNDPSFLASPWWQIPVVSGLRAAAAKQLDLFYVQLTPAVSGNPRLSAEVNYQRLLAQWIMASGPPSAVAAAATNQERRDFFQAEPDPKQFAVAPTRSYRRERTGYPVLMRTPEMPPPLDLYQVQENQLGEETLNFLFPPKGWLPVPLWIRFLAETTVRSP